MKLKLIKPITYNNGKEEVTITELNLDYNNLVGQDIFEVEREMVLIGHPIGNQFVQSPKALATLAIKAAGLPTYLSDSISAQDTMKLINVTAGFLMGVPIVSELPIQLEGPQL